MFFPLFDQNLAAAHGLQRGFMFFGRHTGAAVFVYDKIRLRESGLEDHGIGYHTDIRAQSKKLDESGFFASAHLLYDSGKPDASDRPPAPNPADAPLI